MPKLEVCPYCGARRSPRRMPYHENICLAFGPVQRDRPNQIGHNHTGGAKVNAETYEYAIDERVTCEGCQRALRAHKRGDAVGNLAKSGMGHQYIFTDSGRTAACLSEAWRR